MAKNGSSRSILGQKRVGRSMKAANTEFGLTRLANTTFHPFLAVHRPGPPDSRYFGQLPPGFGHILLHFVALHQSSRFDQPGVEQLQKYPAQMTWVPVENGRKVMWALATSEFRLL